mmetsp:Transcript_85237/g.217142  ORF Transcript_85237/g.217142 Transcript_85237/m.217142 type:complete len:281 (+) Transcript_85237:694-1536(+)
MRHQGSHLELVEPGLQQHLPIGRGAERVHRLGRQCEDLVAGVVGRAEDEAPLRQLRRGLRQRLLDPLGPGAHLLPRRHRPGHAGQRRVFVHDASRSCRLGRLRLPGLPSRAGPGARGAAPGEGSAVPRRGRGRVPRAAGGGGPTIVGTVVAQQRARGKQGAVLELARPEGALHPRDVGRAGPSVQRLQIRVGLLWVLQHGWLSHSLAQRVPHKLVHGGAWSLCELLGRRRLHGRHLRADRGRLLRRRRHRRAAARAAPALGRWRDRAAGGTALCARHAAD